MFVTCYTIYYTASATEDLILKARWHLTGIQLQDDEVGLYNYKFFFNGRG